MKDFIKLIYVAAVGGVTAILLYPLIHEAGHALSAILFGADIKELRIFPNAYVICDVSNARKFGKIVIGLSGVLLPFLLTVFVQPKRFWGWFTCFIVRGVCILSFGISFFAIVLFNLGREIENEDIVQVLKIEPMFGWLYALVFVGLMSIDIYLVVKSRPIQKCIKYFDL